MGPSWVGALGLIFGKVYIVWVCAPRYKPLSCRRNRIREKRISKFGPNFVPKIKLEIVVEQSMTDQVVETIKSSAHTGKIGDGKIFVLDVQQTIRVRTGETGADAI